MYSPTYDHVSYQQPYQEQTSPPLMQRFSSGSLSSPELENSPDSQKRQLLLPSQAHGYEKVDSLTYGPSRPYQPISLPVERTEAQAKKALGKRGGWQPIIVLVDSILILGASLFSFYAQNHHIAISQGKLTNKVINASNISALVSGVGVVLAAIYVWGLGLLGRMWLYRKVSKGEKVELRHLMVIASRGALTDLHHAFRVAGLLFIVTICISWYIPAAISGALNPTLAQISERVNGQIPYLQLAGSNGHATIGPAGDCRSSEEICPAKEYYADHYQSLQFALGDSKPYFSSWGAKQISNPLIPITPSHLGLSQAWERISKHKLTNYSSVVRSEACVPLTQPNVYCEVVLDDPDFKVTGNQISYVTPCGSKSLSLDDSSQQGGSVTDICEVPENDHLTKFYHIVMSDEPNGEIRQLRCDVTVQESFKRLRFWAGSASEYVDTGPCQGGSYNLTHDESRSLITSVVYVLQGAAQQLKQASGASQTQRNPLYAQVYETMNDTTRFAALDMMVKNGIQTAASILYGIGSDGTLIVPTSGYMDVLIWYNAYSWGSGWKGYIWASLLLLAGSLGTCISFAALFVRRLRYDPSDYAQTLFLDKAAISKKDEVEVWARSLPPRHTKLDVALKTW